MNGHNELGLVLSSNPHQQGSVFMARPLRIEYSGAIYHVTARGNTRSDIYLEDADRKAFLKLLGEVCERYNCCCHAYCLMTNHYHLLIETAEANLSQGMRQLNGVYTQTFNRRHHRVGHVFQGRYKSILVERDSYLLEAIRYVILNPVRAGMIKTAGQYRWSSYRSMIGRATTPEWLNRDWALSQFGKRVSNAQKHFVEFIRAGSNGELLWNKLRQQMYLGDEAFIEKLQSRIEKDKDLSEIPRIQKRRSRQSLTYYFKNQAERDKAIIAAYKEGGFTQKQIADHIGRHYSTVSKIINNHKHQENLVCHSRFKT